MNRLHLATITGAHGLRGEVKLRCFTENPLDVSEYGPLMDAKGAEVHIKILRTNGVNGVIASIQSITTREAAEALKGTQLFVSADALPPAGANEFYTRDLIGLRAVDAAGATIGTVKAVENYGAGELLLVECSNGANELYPFKHEFFGAVDIEAGTIIFHAPEVLE